MKTKTLNKETEEDLTRWKDPSQKVNGLAELIWQI